MPASPAMASAVASKISVMTTAAGMPRFSNVMASSTLHGAIFACSDPLHGLVAFEAPALSKRTMADTAVGYPSGPRPIMTAVATFEMRE